MNSIVIKKFLISISAIVSIFLSGFLLLKSYDIFKDYFSDNSFSSGVIIDIPIQSPLTGSLNFGSNSSSGQIIIINNSGSNSSSGQIIEKSFIERLNTEFKKISYILPPQPTTIPSGYSYNQRSQIIVDYMTKNTLTVNGINSKEAYIYIKLSKSPEYPIFIYWHGSNMGGYPRSGDLILSQAKERISDTEYIFNISRIPYIKYSDKKSSFYNWLDDLNNGNSSYVAIASKSFDGTYVQNIDIYYSK